MIERDDLKSLQGPFGEVLEEDLTKRTSAMLKRIPTDHKLEWNANEDVEKEFIVLGRIVSDVIGSVFIKPFINDIEGGKRYVVAPDYGPRNYVLEFTGNTLSITPTQKRRTLSDLID